MQTNPVELLEPLHVPTPETPVLPEAEVAGTAECVPIAEDVSDRIAEDLPKPENANGGHWRGV